MNIASLCDLVPQGHKQRFDCPKCGGHNSLSIDKKAGRTEYKCFKGKCNSRGSIHVVMNSKEIKNALEGHREEKKAFLMPVYWIRGIASKTCFKMLLNSNCMGAYMADMFKVAYDPRLDRLVFLIQDDNKRIVGGVGRTCSNATPKSYNYTNNTDIPFTCGTGSIGVIVEDCMSACSIGNMPDYTGIALLGTDCSDSYLLSIINKYDNIVIAYDKDAMYKSVKLRSRIKYYRDNVSIWKLKKDLKYMNLTEKQAFISDKDNIIV